METTSHVSKFSPDFKWYCAILTYLIRWKRLIKTIFRPIWRISSIFFYNEKKASIVRLKRMMIHCFVSQGIKSSHLWCQHEGPWKNFLGASCERQLIQYTAVWIYKKRWIYHIIWTVRRNWRQNLIVLVFCYQNCSDLLWEKIVLVIEKIFWNSRLKAENLQFLRSLVQFIQTVKSRNNFW